VSDLSSARFSSRQGKSQHSRLTDPITACHSDAAPPTDVCPHPIEHSVPTDYSDPTAGLTHLAMTKIPSSLTLPSSSSHPKRSLGSVLINYGGPGVSGYTSSFTFGKAIHRSIGGKFDVISWDPRGIGRTRPVVDCWGGELEASVVKANMPEELGLEVVPRLKLNHNDSSSSSSSPDPILTFQLERFLAQNKLQASRCAASRTSNAEMLKHLGTTTLIKDTERINAVLEGPHAMINGIGGSYGTIWAAYLLGMLPGKVGKVVAHGVADPVM
jgi:pimeloyl-ACP methyl ester carboxylesterase